MVKHYRCQDCTTTSSTSHVIYKVVSLDQSNVSTVRTPLRVHFGWVIAWFPGFQTNATEKTPNAVCIACDDKNTLNIFTVKITNAV